MLCPSPKLPFPIPCAGAASMIHKRARACIWHLLNDNLKTLPTVYDLQLLLNSTVSIPIHLLSTLWTPQSIHKIYDNQFTCHLDQQCFPITRVDEIGVNVSSQIHSFCKLYVGIMGARVCSEVGKGAPN